VQAAYNENLQRKHTGAVWASGCRSWYLDARGRNTTLWPGFTFVFRRQTARFDAGAYVVGKTVPSEAYAVDPAPREPRTAESTI
jgi:cyclohexanone monooxygenase